MDTHKDRYKERIKTLSQKGESAFIPFAVAGDPDPETSTRVFETYIRSGADILEIGIPFSDPIADGPTNSLAAQRALEKGTTVNKCFSILKGLRKKTDIPFGLLLYSNTAYRYGYEKFCRKCFQSGVDSILVADLPPDEGETLRNHADHFHIKTVHIISELTSDERIKRIASNTTGFIYLVSRLGITGERKGLSSSVKNSIKRIKKHTDLPVFVGFGISTPEHVRKVIDAGAEGAIVGSALVKTIQREKDSCSEMLNSLAGQVSDFKRATKRRKR